MEYRMKNINEGIKKIIKTFIDDGQTAGANVLVFKDGKEVAYCNEGLRDVEKNIPFSRDTIFRLYSQTKPITAASVILLMSQGNLDLSSPLSKYFPEYSTMYINDGKGRRIAQKEITVKDLLNMSAGFSYPDGNTICGRQSEAFFDDIVSNLHASSPMTTTGFAKKAAGLELCFEPGTHFRYSICADLLGALVEKISGQSFGDFLRTNFFVPLEMLDTDFFVPPEKKDRLAKAYNFIDGRYKENPTDFLGNIYLRDQQPAFESGGAGLVSTVDDYMHFASMLMNGGMYNGKRIMDKAAVDFLTKSCDEKFSADLQSTFGWMKGYSYGNLMRICIDDSAAAIMTTRGEYGWDGWMGSFFSNDPENKISFIMGTQVPGLHEMGTLARQIKNYIACGLS